MGEWKPGEKFIQESKFQELDHGHDFYAPQSFLAPDGRRIVIGWMDMWESPLPEQQDGWAGMLTLPRELFITPNNQLHMRPVHEVESLREEWYSWPISTLKNKQLCVMHNCEVAEVIVTWDTSLSEAEQYGIELDDGMRLYIDNQAKRLILERNYPQYNLCGQRSIPMPTGDELKLRVFFDRSSVEVFVNDGEACLSSRIYPQQRQLNVFAWSGNAILKECGAWNLR